MAKLTKRQKQIRELVDINKVYSPLEGVSAVKKAAISKFDETIEVAFRLGINPKHADQQVRNTVTLPAGTGKQVRIAVIAKGEAVKAAELAGADFAGAEELLAKIQGGWMDFDLLLATQDIMPAVAKLGKVLGPRGLMPNLKAGTVILPETMERSIKEFKAGKIEFRNDRQGNVHVPIGKASFDDKDLAKNFAAIADAIAKAKPSSAKGVYMRSLTLSSTMGPGLVIDTNRLSELASVQY